MREEGFLPLPEAAHRLGKSTRSLERRRQEGRLQVETFTIGKAHRVLTRPEWLAAAGLPLPEREPAREYMIEPFHRASPSSESALRRLVEELTRENIELRLRVAELEERLGGRSGLGVIVRLTRPGSCSRRGGAPQLKRKVCKGLMKLAKARATIRAFKFANG